MITDSTTIKELSAEMAELRASFRVIYRRNTFAVQVEWARGSATFNNAALGPALDGALALLRMQMPEPLEPASPDPNGARVGRAPRPDPTGTHVGPPPAADRLHCAVCGYGEEPGQTYAPSAACPRCGITGTVCAHEPLHEGNHEPREGA